MGPVGLRIPLWSRHRLCGPAGGCIRGNPSRILRAVLPNLVEAHDGKAGAVLIGSLHAAEDVGDVVIAEGREGVHHAGISGIEVVRQFGIRKIVGVNGAIEENS